MQNNNKKKICLIVLSLGKGGAERSSALLSKILVSLGHDVHIVSVLNDIEYDFEGTLLNLGLLKDKDDTILGRISRFFTFKKYLKEHGFDYIIDSRTRTSLWRELLVSKLVYDLKKTIYVVRSYDLAPYLGRHALATKLIYKKAYKIVSVSNKIKERIETEFGFNNVTTIFNPVSHSELQLTDEKDVPNFKYILFYGRLNDKIKNISLLLESFRNSKLSAEGIKLVILGDGPDKQYLMKTVNDFTIHDSVVFLPHTSRPQALVSNALFTVLSSRYEGFPRTIIESLSLGIPVVSVDCNSGPSEIIDHEQNGLLIENNNPEALANAMNRFIFDDDLYQHCKNNALKSVNHLSLERIAEEWSKLLI